MELRLLSIREALYALVVGWIFQYITVDVCFRNAGFEDNLQTYGLVSGFFNSGFSLGAFVAPSAAGYFNGQLGFAWSSSICGFVNFGVVSLYTSITNHAEL